MKISYSWIKQYLPELKASPQELAEKISVSLAEVESVAKKGEDWLLEIENKALTHRPDCFGQIGLAREISAMFNIPLQLPEIAKPSKIDVQWEVAVKVTSFQVCPRYTCLMMDGFQVKPSPHWLKTALERMGLRSINNLVDISNYVMLESAQPLHIFDADKLKVKDKTLRIGVRRARAGEKVKALDRKLRTLNSEILVITDENQRSRPIALAGIMGGASTEVSAKTKRILIESACFDQYTIRRASRDLALRTEASLRFEKGQDPNQTKAALYKTVSLIKKHAGGRVVSPLTDLYKKKRPARRLRIDREKLKTFIGAPELEQKKVILILKNLALNPGAAKTDRLEVVIPSFRPDLKIPEDIYEEVARIYGLNRLKPTLPLRSIQATPRHKFFDFKKKTKELLQDLQFNELYTYSFVGSQLWQKCGLDTQALIKVLNPISPELTHLRSLLLPSLIAKAVENSRWRTKLRLFEISLVTPPEKDWQGLIDEPTHLAGCVGSIVRTLPSAFDFSVSEQLWQTLRFLSKSWGAALHASKVQTQEKCRYPLRELGQILLPSQCFIIEAGPEREKVGMFGEVKESVRRQMGLDQTVLSAFELRLDRILSLSTLKPTYAPILIHTPIKIDVTLILAQPLAAFEIEQLLQEKVGNWQLEIMQEPLYESNKEVTLTFHLSFNSHQQQLKKEDVLKKWQQMKKGLVQKLAVKSKD